VEKMATQERTFHGLEPQSDIETPNGAVLETRVADALANSGNLSPADITVVDVDGTIYLRGMVSSQVEVDRAADVAISIQGVKSIVNDLTVEAGHG
jgi:osmotically-inducible protein OsmY